MKGENIPSSDDSTFYYTKLLRYGVQGCNMYVRNDFVKKRNGDDIFLKKCAY